MKQKEELYAAGGEIFLSVMAVFSVAFLIAGYLLLSHSLETNVKRELDFALRQYQFDKFSVQADLIANEEYLNSIMAGTDTSQKETVFFRELSRGIEEPVCLMTEGGKVLYSGGQVFDDLPFTALTPAKPNIRW